jgi:hypothetical protein
LAWRFPPRLRRWRTVLPEDAGIGEPPHSIEKAASERRRPGCPRPRPAAPRQFQRQPRTAAAAGVLPERSAGPVRRPPRQLGAQGAIALPSSRRASLVAAVVVTIGPGRSRAAACASRSAGSPPSWSQSSAGAVTSSTRRALAVWRRALTALARARRRRGSSRRRRHRPWARRSPRRPARPGGCLSSHRIRLATPATGRSIRAVDLQDRLALGAQEPRQSGSITASPFDPNASTWPRSPAQSSNPW